MTTQEEGSAGGHLDHLQSPTKEVEMLESLKMTWIIEHWCRERKRSLLLQNLFMSNILVIPCLVTAAHCSSESSVLKHRMSASLSKTTQSNSNASLSSVTYARVPPFFNGVWFRISKRASSVSTCYWNLGNSKTSSASHARMCASGFIYRAWGQIT